MSRLCTVHVQSVQSNLRPRSLSGMGQINFMFNGCRELKNNNKIFFNYFFNYFSKKNNYFNNIFLIAHIFINIDT